MKFNTLTLTLHNFVQAFSGGSGRVAGAANGLLASLACIDIVLIGLWWALDGGERLSAMFRKLLYMGFWIWMVRSFPSLAKSFVDSLIQAGQLAGGGSGGPGLLMDPSAIAGYGLDATEPLAKKISDLGITDFGEGLVYGFSYLAIMACFLVMAVHVFLAVLEYYLIVAVVGILMPFGLLQSTKFLAEKAIGAVVAAAIKLMVLSFVLSAVEPVLSTSMKFSSEDIPFNELFAMFLTVCALMLLTWKAPHLAASLMAGSPNLGAGDVTAPAVASAGAAAAIASGSASYFATKAAASANGLPTATRAAAGALTRTAPTTAITSRPMSSEAPASAASTAATGASANAKTVVMRSAPAADKTLVMSSSRPSSGTQPLPQLSSLPPSPSEGV